MPWLEPLLVGVFGGLLALERRAFLQAMLSRPLVAGTLTGLLLQDAQAGLYIGLVFELLHLGGASLGGAHPENEMLPAIAATAMASMMGKTMGSDSTPAMWALAILIAVPAGPIGKRVENRLDARAKKYFGRALTATDHGFYEKAARQNMRAMWPHFVFYGLFCFTAAFVGPVLAQIEQRLPLTIMRGLAWAYPAMGVVAAAQAIHGSRAPHRRLIAFAAAALTTALTLAQQSGAN